MKKLLTVLMILTMSLSSIAATKKTATKKTTSKNTTAKKTTTKKATSKKTTASKTYQTGIASFYGGKWHGRKTANGEIFNTNSLTAAHKTLPFNTRVKVTNLSNGKSVIVRINNRGPYIKGRIIDLSTAAFTSIESRNKGITRVKLEIVK